MTTLEPDGARLKFKLQHRMSRALEDANLSVPQIAQELGVSRVTVWRWLHGAVHPSTAILKLWAIRTGVAYDWLLYGDDDPKSWPDWDMDNPSYRPLETVNA